MISNNLKDVINNAKYLFAMHPAPWGFVDVGGYGCVVDGNDDEIFGGDVGEGYVCKDDIDIVALVDVINSLWVYMKDRK